MEVNDGKPLANSDRGNPRPKGKKKSNLTKSGVPTSGSRQKVRCRGKDAVYQYLFQKALSEGKIDLASKICRDHFPKDVSITFIGDCCIFNPPYEDHGPSGHGIQTK